MRVPGGVLLVMAACGGAHTGTGNTDSGVHDAAVTDGRGGDAATICAAGRPWGAPVAITALNTAQSDANPRMSADELTVYFQSSRGGTGVDSNLYSAHRASLGDAFAAPTALTALNTSTANESDITVSTDGLTAVFNRASDLYIATRTSTLASFGAPSPANTVNTASVEAQPFLTAAGDGMWFTSDRTPTQGSNDIWYAPIVNGAFSTPVAIAELDSTASDVLATPSADGLEIYFSSARVATGTKGSYDIWTATRVSTAVSFSAPTLVTELNTAGSDLPGWLSADGCRLYMSIAPVGGQYDIYMATRTP